MLLSTSILLAVHACLVSAHGTVKTINVAGKANTPWQALVYPYRKTKPESFTRQYDTNGPVRDVSSIDLRCNTNRQVNSAGKSNQPAARQDLNINAGDQVEFEWSSSWPNGHKGPIMTYMAKCPNDNCRNWDGSGNVWFKVQNDGLLDAEKGIWATNKLITDGYKTSFEMPTDLAPGAYILRHELLALHSAKETGGAQFYPSCHQITLKSEGTLRPKGYAIPGVYSADDPGVKLSIYYPKVKAYEIPGPPLYSEDTGNAKSPAGLDTPSSRTTTSNKERTGSSTSKSTATDRGRTKHVSDAETSTDDSVAVRHQVAAIIQDDTTSSQVSSEATSQTVLAQAEYTESSSSAYANTPLNDDEEPCSDELESASIVETDMAAAVDVTSSTTLPESSMLATSSNDDVIAVQPTVPTSSVQPTISTSSVQRVTSANLQYAQTTSREAYNPDVAASAAASMPATVLLWVSVLGLLF